MPRGEKGFTLIELLIVVVIIGILAAVALLKTGPMKDKARVASLKADIHNVIVAEEAYYSDYKTYGNFNKLTKFTRFMPSEGNSVTINANAKGFIATVTNSAITKGVTTCQVKVGRNASVTIDGRTICS